jgi:hypothetical protein
MQKNISLSIPDPCGERWENFTPTNLGGLCSACHKTVIDFTKASDAEIVDFFKGKPAHACGRFRTDQLKLYSYSNDLKKINPGFMLLKAGLLSLLVALLNKPSIAQGESVKPVTEVSTLSVPAEKKSTVKGGFTVSGVVLDELGEPIPGVNVLLKGTVRGLATDADGKFTFTDINEGDVLVFAFIGFNTREFIVPRRTEAATISITLELDMVVMGELAVNEIYEPHESIFKRVLTKVKSIF